MWEYNYNYGEYLQHGFLSNAKKAAHKYIDKIKSKTGKWLYIYKEDLAKSKSKAEYDKSALDYSKKMEAERAGKQAAIKNEATNLKNKKAGEERAKIEKTRMAALTYSKKMDEERRSRESEIAKDVLENEKRKNEYKKSERAYSVKAENERKNKESEIQKELNANKKQIARDEYNRVANQYGLLEKKTGKIKKQIDLVYGDNSKAYDAYSNRLNSINSHMKEVKNNNSNNTKAAEQYVKDTYGISLSKFKTLYATDKEALEELKKKEALEKLKKKEFLEKFKIKK